MSKRELIIIIAGVVVFAAAALLIVLSAGAEKTSAALGPGRTLAAEDSVRRQEFLRQFGWDADPQPMSVREVIMPAAMDEALSEYNKIQLRQGFDMADLCGSRIRLWTYSVKNYPGRVSACAHVMTKDGVVVGGDISGTAAGGFTHGFDPAVFSAETAAVQAQANVVDRSVPDSIPANEHIPPEPDGDEGED